MSHVIWNVGMLFPVPQERFPLLHKIHESKPPLSIHFFAEVRGAHANGERGGEREINFAERTKTA